jgi:putative nucleotidyltransferase with HDIG domain
MTSRRPPRLLVRTLVVTFGTSAALLLLVFVLVRMTVRDQVRRTVAQNLDTGQRLLATLEDRRRQELTLQAATLVENPTLKAAVDTYAAEARSADRAARAQLLATVQRELDKLSTRLESDAVALVDVDGESLGVAGPLADEWSHGHARQLRTPGSGTDNGDTLIDTGTRLLRVISVPLTLDDGATIGRLDLARALDAHYAAALDTVSGARIAIVNDGVFVAGSITARVGQLLQQALREQPAGSELAVDGRSYSYREIARLAGVRVFALSSIDDAAADAVARMNRSLALLALGAFLLALVGSVWLATLLTRPIKDLSARLELVASARDWGQQLPHGGSSRELDALTSTFNHLMSSMADAELRTEAAYAGAIRALAAALDARDPYTAGHSERVSVLSVAIGRVLRLTDTDVDVLRMGALLHDIGKIGISDQVLRKSGPLTDDEYAAIREHPVVGARILKTIPFLLPHLDIVELHHERPDGLGYPKGLRGEDIPLLARIVHVADAYDAITTARAYRNARSSAEALTELWRCAGTEYHAEIVDALARALAPTVAAEPESVEEALIA